MSKPLFIPRGTNLFIVIIITSFVVLFGSFTGYNFFVKDGEPRFPIEGIKKVSETKIGETKTYKDEAGFSFEYPEEAMVTDVTPDEQVYYSALEISHSKKSGKINLSIKDTENSTIEEWVNDDQKMRMAEVSGATSLGALSAKQFNLNRAGEKLMITAAIGDNILYAIEGPNDEYWEEVQNLIASSFVVGERASSGGTSVPTDEGVIYEEEEIVE